MLHDPALWVAGLGMLLAFVELGTLPARAGGWLADG
jgi:hypothetical protein